MAIDQSDYPSRLHHRQGIPCGCQGSNYQERPGRHQGSDQRDYHRSHHHQHQTIELAHLVVHLRYQPNHLGRYQGIQEYYFARSLPKRLDNYLLSYHQARLHSHQSQCHSIECYH